MAAVEYGNTFWFPGLNGATSFKAGFRMLVAWLDGTVGIYQPRDLNRIFDTHFDT
jgi:hypothetical protein